MPSIIRPPRSTVVLAAAVGSLATLAACSPSGTPDAGGRPSGTAAAASTRPTASTTATLPAAPTTAPTGTTDGPAPTASRTPPAAATPPSFAAPAANQAALSTPGPVRSTSVTLPAPSCLAHPGDQWISVTGAPVQDGEGVFVVNDRTTSNCLKDFGPVVKPTTTPNPTYYLAANAEVTLLSTDYVQTRATVADFEALFTAHAAGKSGADGFVWQSSLYTVHLDASGAIDSISDGILTSDN